MQPGVLVVVVALLASVVVLPAPAAQAAASGDAWLEESFEESIDVWSEGWTGRSSIRNVVRPGSGVDGAGIEIVIPPGEHYGSDMRWRFASNGLPEPDAAWFRYWLRIEVDGPVGSGKVPGLTGLYSRSGRGNVPPTEVAPGWSARLQFWGLHPSDQVEIGSYVYHLDQARSFGDGIPWSEGVTAGEWVCVEGHVAMNTPGIADGVTLGFLDGVEVHREEGLRFRSAQQDGVGIEAFWLAVYHGGAEPADVEHRIGIDELVVADRRVGCGPDPSWGFNDIQAGPFADAATRLEALGVLTTCEVTGRRFCPSGTFGDVGLRTVLARAAALDGRPAAAIEAQLAEDLGGPAASAAKERVVLALDALLAGVPAPWQGEFDVVAEPGDDIQAAFDAAGPGGTVLIAAGAHEVDGLVPREAQRIVGEPGAILVPAPGAETGVSGARVSGVTLAGVEVMGFDRTGIETGDDWALDHVGLTSNRDVGVRVGGDLEMREVVAWGNGTHVDIPVFAEVRMRGGTLREVNVAGDRPTSEAWSVRSSGAALISIEDVRFAGGRGGGVWMDGGGAIVLSRVVALGLDGAVVDARGARAVAVSNSILQGNGLVGEVAAVVVDAPVVVVASSTFRDNGGGVVLRPSSRGVLGAVVGNRFADRGPSGIAAHPWSTAALLDWDRNIHRSDGALTFVVGSDLVSATTWLTLPVDGASSFDGG